MVGLNDAGEVAWFAESLFNYVLDTEKPLTNSILAFSRDALDEFEKQVDEKYANQHLIDTAAWGVKTENVSLDADVEEIEATDDQQDVAAEDVIEVPSEELFDVEAEEKLSVDTLDGVETASFSIINDKSMREVFVQEAQVNLAKISDQIDQGLSHIVEDDVTSISIHTLLGNAKTLGLDDLADAYNKAEDLCLIKQESGAEVTNAEKAAFASLIQATKKCIETSIDEEPYFIRDEQEWSKISEDLQDVLDRQPNLLVNVDLDDIEIDLDADTDLVEVESFEQDSIESLSDDIELSEDDLQTSEIINEDSDLSIDADESVVGIELELSLIHI